MPHSRKIGAEAESTARQFLEKHGLTFKEKNFIAMNPAGKICGEIDLIMLDSTCYIFTEVKLREQADYGDTLEIITAQKQGRIKLAAKYYLTAHDLWDRVNCRFDVVGITPSRDARHHPIIVWIKNAFEVQY